MIKPTLIAVAIFSVLSPISNANVIVFDNLNGATTTNASPNDLSASIGGETLDDATLATTTVVTGINWSGVYLNGDNVVATSDDNFQIRIYADNAGTPGPLLQTFAVGNAVNRTSGTDLSIVSNPNAPNGPTVRVVPSFNYSADINFTFNAGITHWLSVLNNTTADSDDFFQSVIPAGGNAFGDLNPNDGQYIPQGFITDFQLTVVPEPSSVGILALGLMGLLARRKRS